MRGKLNASALGLVAAIVIVRVPAGLTAQIATGPPKVHGYRHRPLGRIDHV